MQMHESKTGSTSTRSGSSTASSIKANKNNLPNNRVTSSAINDNNNNSNHNFDQNKKGKKKSNRDKNQAGNNDDAKPASVMSNLSSYSLIDDDHIDDQETINVGNLIIDLESDLEKEKIENEQANNSTDKNAKALSTSASNAPSSTSITPSVSSKTNNSKTSGTHTNTDSKSNSSKSGQKASNKYSNSASVNSVGVGSITPNFQNNSINPNNGHAVPQTIFKSSAGEKGELKMKITRETKAGKNDQLKISANPKSPTSSVVGAISRRSPTYDAESKDINADSMQSSSISSTKECGTSTSVGTITEPDCLGPCEPGTSVTLEGIVWQETDGGILVVNVTWRGKTYVGALLDCTRHDWAPPRLCDSPASDIDLKTSKSVRTKRIVTRSNGNSSLDEKNLLQTTGKLRNGKGRRIPAANESTSSCSKKQRDSSTVDNAQTESYTPQGNTSSINNSETSNLPMNAAENATHNLQSESITSSIPIDKAAPSSPMLIGCDEPNCSKKYRNLNGLSYHQAHAHGAENDTPTSQFDNCSSSTKERVDNNKGAKNETSSDLQIAVAKSIDRLSPQPVGIDNRSSKEDQQPPTESHKRLRTPSPQPSRMSKLANPINNNLSSDTTPTQLMDPNNSPFLKRLENERRHSNSSGHGSGSMRSGDLSRRSPGAPQQARSLENQHNSPATTLQHHSSSSKTGSSGSKQSNQLPPLPAPTEEGMKPSGTSTGPPPAPHQANCYFNPAFLAANQFNPYAIPPSYFPRSVYDPMAPPTSNANFLRFMSNMRAPPPPSDSPSRLLSPSMPKNLPPFPPFKVDPTVPLPTPNLGGHPIPNISPSLSNHHPPPPHPPPHSLPLPQGPPPPVPPLSLGGAPSSLRMPSQVDPPMLPPTSQPPYLPPTSLSSFLNLPGMNLPNPLASLGGPHMPNLVDDQLAKQYQRRFN